MKANVVKLEYLFIKSSHESAPCRVVAPARVQHMA